MQVYRLVVGPIEENCYIVASEETGECIVIDPGSEGKRILEEIARRRLRVALIVNSHGHADHTGAVATLKEATGATYAIHRGDLETVRNGASRARSWLPDFVDPPEPDRFLEAGEMLEAGEVTLRVLETPGHTPGAVCFFTQGMVFTGDTLFQRSIGRFDLPGGDGRLLLESIRTKLLTLPDETQVLPGHGPASTIGAEKGFNPFLQPGAERLLFEEE